MVTIVDVAKAITKDGSPLISLVVIGAIEPVVSQTTGRVYMSAKKTRVPCTFNFEVAKSMVGQTLPGTVKRIECNPYTVTFPGSNKKVTLKHTFVYDPTPLSVESVVG
jgi:hypothetical protein